MLVCVIHEMNRLLDSGSIGTALEVELPESRPPD